MVVTLTNLSILSALELPAAERILWEMIFRVGNIIGGIRRIKTIDQRMNQIRRKCERGGKKKRRAQKRGKSVPYPDEGGNRFVT